MFLNRVEKISGREGIEIKQGKTGKKQIKAWTPRLRGTYKVATSANEKVAPLSPHVVLNKTEGRIAYDTLHHWRTAAKQAAASNNPKLTFDFTFHDVKAKSISDWEGYKQVFSGHKTQSQVAI